jgi:hypothetical protein
MSHVVLLGDSIFDNASYVPGGPCVREQVARALGTAWKVTLLAVDGDTSLGVPAQVRRIPADASHLILSVGGNDALSAAWRLRGDCRSFPEAMNTLADIRAQFQSSYRHALDAVLGRRLPTAICAVYDRVPGLGPGDSAGLALFNELILREAVQRGVGLIDLRIVCSEPGDYSVISPIEPSVQGGWKIARAIARAVDEREAALPRSCVFV